MIAPAHDIAEDEWGEEVYLRIPAAKLLRLFLSENLHAEDFRCLDPHSKNLVWRLLLSSSPRPPESTGPGGRPKKRNSHEC